MDVNNSPFAVAARLRNRAAGGNNTGEKEPKGVEQGRYNAPGSQKGKTEAAMKRAYSDRAELKPESMATGQVTFTILIFLAAAYPWILPYLYLLFSLVAIPLRIYDFLIASPRNAFFLLDFCYWVNISTIVFLVLPPMYRDPRVESALYALADGPVAFGMLAWECAWVLSSKEHTISVLIHLLPGLAMYAHHHLPRLQSWGQLAYCLPLLKSPSTALHFTSCVSLEAPLAASLTKHWISTTLVWLIAAPVVFYIMWQLVYWFVVQICCRKYIKKNNLDTSFKCLARRAIRSDSVLADIVLRGSVNRQICMYGMLQLLFTLGTLCFFVPTYYSWHLALVWQVLKFFIPMYYGARHFCHRLIQAAISEGIRDRRAEARRKKYGEDAVTGSLFSGGSESTEEVSQPTKQK
jgi:hypothetical protein